MGTEWKKRWGYEMAASPSRPGVYRLKAGGYYLRARIKDPRIGKRKPIDRVTKPETGLLEAVAQRVRMIEEAEARLLGPQTRQRWSTYAASLLERRILQKSIESEATKEWWADTLEHVLIPALGHLWADEVDKVKHIDPLITQIGIWIRDGHQSFKKRPNKQGELVREDKIVSLSPTTANGWLRILRTISHAIAADYRLAHSAFKGVEFFKEDPAHTREEPNSLPPEDVGRFIRIAKRKEPQHFAELMLGFVTGLRLSTLRPIRIRGPERDLDWTTGLLQVRRSNTRKQTVMEKTKTGVDQEIALPDYLLEVLQDHVALLEDPPKSKWGKRPTWWREPMADSIYLFPSRKGGLQSRNALAKPFAKIARLMDVPYRLTPKAMRRSFVDLARAAELGKLIRRSISGHQTDEMEERYSTMRFAEQRQALDKVARVAAIAGPPIPPSLPPLNRETGGKAGHHRSGAEPPSAVKDGECGSGSIFPSWMSPVRTRCPAPGIVGPDPAYPTPAPTQLVEPAVVDGSASWVDAGSIRADEVASLTPYTLDGTTFFGDGAEHEALDLPVPEPWTFYDVYAGCYGDPHPAGASC